MQHKKYNGIIVRQVSDTEMQYDNVMRSILSVNKSCNVLIRG